MGLKGMLPRFKNKKIFLIGIGGGGDVLGCLPLANYLGRNKNQIILGGLSWKRKPHDPQPGPRKISEFVNIKRVNQAVGWVSSQTRTKKGIKHIEADLAGILDYSIITISINSGFKSTFESIREFVDKEKIDLVIGVDVGGDVLLKGNEETIRSPICDSIMLAVLAHLDKAFLGVIGLGGDGELPLTVFGRYFEEIKDKKGFLGCMTFSDSQFGWFGKIIRRAKTESSKPIIKMAEGCSEKKRASLAGEINQGVSMTKIFKRLKIKKQYFREKSRIGELSCLTPLLFLFDPKVVYQRNLHQAIIEKSTSVQGLRTKLNKRGIITELDEGN